MDITLDKKSNTSALIKISLKELDYQPKVEEKIKDYARKAQIKGFRPGKVPHGLVKNMYGKSILIDEVNHILGHKLEDYIRESDLQILGRPLPVEETFTSINWDTQKDFDFAYEIGFAEDFDPALSKKIKVTDYQIEVDDKAIDETIDNLRSQYGDNSNPEVSEEGDLVFGEVKSADGSVTESIAIDTNDIATKTQKKQFVGVKSGDELTFDIRKVLGKDDAAVAKVFGMSDEQAAEITGDYTMTVKNINRQSQAELNEEFFNRVLGEEKAKDEASFRAELKVLLEKSYAQETQGYLAQNIREKLVETFDFEIPVEFLKKWLVESNEEMTAEQVEENFEQYAKDIRWQLIESKIGKANEIKAEHTEILDKTVMMFKGQFGAMAANPEFEEQLKAIADNYLKGENGENYFRMYNMVFSEKVIEHVKGAIELKEKKVSLDEFKKLF